MRIPPTNLPRLIPRVLLTREQNTLSLQSHAPLTGKHTVASLLSVTRKWLRQAKKDQTKGTRRAEAVMLSIAVPVLRLRNRPSITLRARYSLRISKDNPSSPRRNSSVFSEDAQSKAKTYLPRRLPPRRAITAESFV